MLTLIAALIVVAILLLAVICVQLVKLNTVGAAERDRLDDIFRAQLNPRTRIGGPFAIQSGAVSEDQEVQRLGRATVGRRIVVGGDDDSQLKRDLTTQLQEAQDG